LVASSYFSVEKYELKSAQGFPAVKGKSSARILVATEGVATLRVAGCDPVTFKKGDAVVVPASIADFEIHPSPDVQFLKSSVPGSPVSEPDVVNP
jgi:uncharacterized protein YjlB